MRFSGEPIVSAGRQLVLAQYMMQSEYLGISQEDLGPARCRGLYAISLSQGTPE